MCSIALQSVVTVGPASHAQNAIKISSKTFNQASSLHMLFLKIIDQIEELLQSELNLLTETCKSLMASEVHGINLFSTTCMENLNKYDNAVSLLRCLCFLFTWSNHSVLRALISFSSKAVQLLDEFDFSLDPFNTIASYPIPSFSQDMIPSETSEYTVLAIRCNKELWQCSLQYVFNLQSSIVDKCDITQHCLQLLAVKSDPTVFYWTIPKCVVELVKSNTLQHCEYLYSQGILELIVYPKQSLAISDDVIMGSLAFKADRTESFAKMVIANAKLIYYNIYSYAIECRMYKPNNIVIHDKDIASY